MARLFLLRIAVSSNQAIRIYAAASAGHVSADEGIKRASVVKVGQGE